MIGEAAEVARAAGAVDRHQILARHRAPLDERRVELAVAQTVVEHRGGADAQVEHDPGGAQLIEHAIALLVRLIGDQHGQEQALVAAAAQAVAVRIAPAGLVEQRGGAGRVVRRRLHRRPVARAARPDDTAHRARQPLARRHQRGPIELADQRAAHARVVERRAAHVEGKVAHGCRPQAQRRQTGGDGHPALLGMMLADERRDDVDLAAARSAQRRRRIRLVAEDDAGHRRRRAPVAGEALQLDGAVAPRAHPVRPGADHLRLGVGRRAAARRRHDRHLGDGAQRVGAGPGQADPHRARPGGLDAGHVGQRGGALARAAGGVDRPHHIGRHQRPPVVKAHVRLQLELQLAARARHPPRTGQARLVAARLGLAVAGPVAHKRLEHRVPDDAHGRHRRRGARIERVRVAVQPHRQGVGGGGHRAQPGARARDRRGHCRASSGGLTRVAPRLGPGRRPLTGQRGERQGAQDKTDRFSRVLIGSENL